MTSSVRTLLKKLFGPSEYRVLVLGLDAAGKTSILYRLKLGETVTTIATIGFNVETISYGKSSITLWDIGGCDKIRPLFRHYFPDTRGFIWVVDARDSQRLDESCDELWKLLSAEELNQLPCLIYLNKTDLENTLNSTEIINRMNLNHIRNRQWLLQPCSVKTGEGVYEGFDWLCQAMKSPHIETRVSIEFTDTSNDDQTSQWLLRVDEDSNEEFIDKFEKYKIPIETFDHRCLLRIIWCYLKTTDRKQTIKSVFEHLKFYQQEINETLVYFWIQIVHYACEATKNPTNDFTGFILMNPQLLNETDLPLTYYTNDILFSKQAQANVSLPDRKPLPSIIPPAAPAPSKPDSQSVDDLDDEEFLKQFESCTLTSWSHKTHVRMAWLYLTREGRRAGVNKIFDGIKNFIEKSSIARKTTFHFTMTYFWIQMIDLAIAQSPKQIDFEEFLRLSPQLLNGGLFLEYYKKETMLNNPLARQEMVLPDIKPLPTFINSSNKK